MKNLWKKLTRFHRGRLHYIGSAQTEIAESNLLTLKRTSVIAAALILFFLLITPILYPGWIPTRAHLLFAPAMLLFYAIASAYGHHKCRKSWAIIACCVAFEVVLLLFVTILDVFLYPNNSSSFMSAVVIALPVLFVLPVPFDAVILTLGSIGYGIALFQLKAAQIAQGDLFRLLVALCVSVVVSNIVNNLRVVEYDLRCRYRSQSLTDELTGVLSKRGCEAKISSDVMQKKNRKSGAFVVFDLDNFKQINDQNGHQIGDEILRAFGALLRDTFDGDIIGRIGGDEFLVVMQQETDGEVEFLHRYQTIQAGMRRLTEKYDFSVSCSAGVAVSQDMAATGYESLFQSADDALYEAKAFGKGRYSIHEVSAKQLTGDLPVMLIVDDDETSRALVRAFFEGQYQFLEAEDGDKTLELISQYEQQIRVILLDIYMPGKNGFEILRYLKSRQRLADIPVVVITSDEANEKQALQNGAADVLPKPLDSDIVHIRVSNALKR